MFDELSVIYLTKDRDFIGTESELVRIRLIQLMQEKRERIRQAKLSTQLLKYLRRQRDTLLRKNKKTHKVKLIQD